MNPAFVMRTAVCPVIGFVAGAMLGYWCNGSMRILTRPTASGAGTKNVINENTPDGTLVTAQASDIDQALRTALRHPSALHRLDEFARVLDSSTLDQFPTIFAGLHGLTANTDPAMLRLLFARWAKLSPSSALQHALSARNFFRSGEFVDIVMTTWARADYAAAAARAESLSEPFASNVAQELRKMRTNVGAAPLTLEMIHRMSERTNGSPAIDEINAVSRFFLELAKSDRATAQREALALPKNPAIYQARSLSLRNLVTTGLRSDREATRQWIDSLPPGSDREALQREYIGGLVLMKQFELAKGYAFGMPNGRERQNIFGQLATSLTNSKHLDGAVALVTSLPATDLQNIFAFDGFLRDWMRTNPMRASALLLEHASTAIDLSEKNQWSYTHHFSNILGPWVNDDPAAATDFILKLPDKARSEALTNSLRTWCQRDAAAAARWAASLPPNATQEEAMRRVAQLWAKHEATEVTQWLDQLPPGIGKYAAAEGFASAVISVNADDALAWVRINPDAADRAERLRRIWRIWRAKEAARAQHWLDNSPELTESERALLRSR